MGNNKSKEAKLPNNISSQENNGDRKLPTHHLPFQTKKKKKKSSSIKKKLVNLFTKDGDEKKRKVKSHQLDASKNAGGLYLGHNSSNFTSYCSPYLLLHENNFNDPLSNFWPNLHHSNLSLINRSDDDQVSKINVLEVDEDGIVRSRKPSIAEDIESMVIHDIYTSVIEQAKEMRFNQHQHSQAMTSKVSSRSGSSSSGSGEVVTCSGGSTDEFEDACSSLIENNNKKGGGGGKTLDIIKEERDSLDRKSIVSKTPEVDEFCDVRRELSPYLGSRGKYTYNAASIPKIAKIEDRILEKKLAKFKDVDKLSSEKVFPKTDKCKKTEMENEEKLIHKLSNLEKKILEKNLEEMQKIVEIKTGDKVDKCRENKAELRVNNLVKNPVKMTEKSLNEIPKIAGITGKSLEKRLNEIPKIKVENVFVKSDEKVSVEKTEILETDIDKEITISKKIDTNNGNSDFDKKILERDSGSVNAFKKRPVHEVTSFLEEYEKKIPHESKWLNVGECSKVELNVSPVISDNMEENIIVVGSENPKIFKVMKVEEPVPAKMVKNQQPITSTEPAEVAETKNGDEESLKSDEKLSISNSKIRKQTQTNENYANKDQINCEVKAKNLNDHQGSGTLCVDHPKPNLNARNLLKIEKLDFGKENSVGFQLPTLNLNDRTTAEMTSAINAIGRDILNLTKLQDQMDDVIDLPEDDGLVEPHLFQTTKTNNNNNSNGESKLGSATEAKETEAIREKPEEKASKSKENDESSLSLSDGDKESSCDGSESSVMEIGDDVWDEEDEADFEDETPSEVAVDIKTKLVLDLLNQAEVDMEDFSAFLNLPCPLEKKYHFLQVQKLFDANQIQDSGNLEELGRCFRVLSRYGLDLLKPEEERPMYWKKILLPLETPACRWLSVQGAQEILLEFGYQRVESGLIYPEDEEPEAEAVAAWVVELLLAAHELSCFSLQAHPQPELFKRSLLRDDPPPPEPNVYANVEVAVSFRKSASVPLLIKEPEPGFEQQTDDMIGRRTLVPWLTPKDAASRPLPPAPTSQSGKTLSPSPTPSVQGTQPPQRCHLCGSSSPAVRCEKCSNLIFCLSCDDMYHRHPKRRDHVRKLAQRPTNPSPPPPRPPPKLTDLSSPPVPPPRRRKSSAPSSPVGLRKQQQKLPELPKKQFPLKFGSLKKLLPNASNKATATLPANNNQQLKQQQLSHQQQLQQQLSHQQLQQQLSHQQQQQQQLSQQQQMNQFQQRQINIRDFDRRNPRIPYDEWGNQQVDQSSSDVDEEDDGRSTGTSSGGGRFSYPMDEHWPMQPQQLPPRFGGKIPTARPMATLERQQAHNTLLRHHNSFAGPATSGPFVKRDNPFFYHHPTNINHSASVMDLSYPHNVPYPIPQVQSMSEGLDFVGAMAPCGCRINWVGPDQFGAWLPPTRCPMHTSRTALFPSPASPSLQQQPPPWGYPYMTSPSPPPQPLATPPVNAPINHNHSIRRDKQPAVTNKKNSQNGRKRESSSEERPEVEPDDDDEISYESEDDELKNVKLVKQKTQKTVKMQQQQNVKKNAEIQAPETKVKVAEDEEWECEHCTFVNDKDSRICSVCCKTKGVRTSPLPTEDVPELLSSPQPPQNVSLTPTKQKKESIYEEVSQPKVKTTTTTSMATQCETPPLDAPSMAPSIIEKIVLKTSSKELPAISKHMTSTGTSPPPQTISTQTPSDMWMGSSDEELPLSPSPPPSRYSRRRKHPGEAAPSLRRAMSLTTVNRRPSANAKSRGKWNQENLRRTASRASLRDTSPTPPPPPQPLVKNTRHSSIRSRKNSDFYDNRGGNSSKEEDYEDNEYDVEEEDDDDANIKWSKNKSNKDHYLSMEKLVEKRRNKSKKNQGLEILHLIKEAEKNSFSADDVQVALHQCGTKEPIEWLKDNWKTIVETVATLASRKDNGIGNVSSAEAKASLHHSKGNIWAAVTNCVENRQKKLKELKRYHMSQSEMSAALTANNGDVEEVVQGIHKSHFKPISMKIYGAGNGAENQAGCSGAFDYQSRCFEEVFTSPEELCSPESSYSSEEDYGNDNVYRFSDEYQSKDRSYGTEARKYYETEDLETDSRTQHYVTLQNGIYRSNKPETKIMRRAISANNIESWAPQKSIITSDKAAKTKRENETRSIIEPETQTDNYYEQQSLNSMSENFNLESQGLFVEESATSSDVNSQNRNKASQLENRKLGYNNQLHENEGHLIPTKTQSPQIVTENSQDLNILTQNKSDLSSNVSQVPQNLGEMPQGTNQLPPNVSQLQQKLNQLLQNQSQRPQSVNEVLQNISQLLQNVNQTPPYVNQMSQDVNQIPQTFNQVQQNFNQVPQNFNQVPQNFNQVPQNVTRVIQNLFQTPQNVNQIPSNEDQLIKSENQMPENSNRNVKEFPQSAKQHSANANQLFQTAHQMLQSINQTPPPSSSENQFKESENQMSPNVYRTGNDKLFSQTGAKQPSHSGNANMLLQNAHQMLQNINQVSQNFVHISPNDNLVPSTDELNFNLSPKSESVPPNLNLQSKTIAHQTVNQGSQIVSPVSQIVEQVAQTDNQVFQPVNQVFQTVNQDPQMVAQVPQIVEQVFQPVNQVKQTVIQVPQTATQVPQTVKQIPQNVNHVPQNVNHVPQTANKILHNVSEPQKVTNKANDDRLNFDRQLSQNSEILQVSNDAIPTQQSVETSSSQNSSKSTEISQHKTSQASIIDSPIIAESIEIARKAKAISEELQKMLHGGIPTLKVPIPSDLEEIAVKVEEIVSHYPQIENLVITEFYNASQKVNEYQEVAKSEKIKQLSASRRTQISEPVEIIPKTFDEPSSVSGVIIDKVQLSDSTESIVEEIENENFDDKSTDFVTENYQREESDLTAENPFQSEIKHLEEKQLSDEDEIPDDYENEQLLDDYGLEGIYNKSRFSNEDKIIKTFDEDDLSEAEVDDDEDRLVLNYHEDEVLEDYDENELQEDYDPMRLLRDDGDYLEDYDEEEDEESGYFYDAFQDVAASSQKTKVSAPNLLDQIPTRKLSIPDNRKAIENFAATSTSKNDATISEEHLREKLIDAETNKQLKASVTDIKEQFEVNENALLEMKIIENGQFEVALKPVEQLETTIKLVEQIEEILKPVEQIESTLKPVAKVEATVEPVNLLESSVIMPVEKPETIVKLVEKLDVTVKPIDQLEATSSPVEEIVVTVEPVSDPIERFEAIAIQVEQLESISNPIEQVEKPEFIEKQFHQQSQMSPDDEQQQQVETIVKSEVLLRSIESKTEVEKKNSKSLIVERIDVQTEVSEKQNAKELLTGIDRKNANAKKLSEKLKPEVTKKCGSAVVSKVSTKKSAEPTSKPKLELPRKLSLKKSSEIENRIQKLAEKSKPESGKNLKPKKVETAKSSTPAAKPEVVVKMLFVNNGNSSVLNEGKEYEAVEYVRTDLPAHVADSNLHVQVQHDNNQFQVRLPLVTQFAEPEVKDADKPSTSGNVNNKFKDDFVRSSTDDSSSHVPSSASEMSQTDEEEEEVEPMEAPIPIKPDLGRRARQYLAEGKLPNYYKAEMAVKLLDLRFEESEAIFAANECSDLYMAVSYLQQDCELCAGRFPMGKMVSMLNCIHRCCRACAKDYFTLKIKERNIVDTSCPFCSEPDLTDDSLATEYFNHLDIMLKNLVEVDVHEIFQRKLRDRALMNDPNFRWCEKCSSGFITEPNRRRIVCPDCKFVTCGHCKKPWEKQHEGITCQQYEEWKQVNDPEYQKQGLETYLAENGIVCPKCKFKYDLAKGGCMHYTCSQCKFEFCSGCGKPFRMAGKCTVSSRCEKLGLHAHHPRNCLFHLRDKEPEELKKLLKENAVEFDEGDEETDKLVTCAVMEQKEESDGNVDVRCGREVEAKMAGLCRKHYVEYLVSLVGDHKVDPVSIMDGPALEQELRRKEVVPPERKPGELPEEYREVLLKVVLQKIPLEETQVPYLGRRPSKPVV